MVQQENLLDFKIFASKGFTLRTISNSIYLTAQPISTFVMALHLPCLFPIVSTCTLKICFRGSPSPPVHFFGGGLGTIREWKGGVVTFSLKSVLSTFQHICFTTLMERCSNRSAPYEKRKRALPSFTAKARYSRAYTNKRKQKLNPLHPHFTTRQLSWGTLRNVNL